MMIQIKSKKDPLFVFQIYSSDSSYRDNEKEEYYVTLQKELNNSPRKSRLTVMGDFNGKIRKEKWMNWSNNVRKFSTCIMNENGEKLL